MEFNDYSYMCHLNIIMIKKAGRPRIPTNKKVVRKNTSYSRESFDYIKDMIETNRWSLKGSWSRVVNQIIKDHKKVAIFKMKQKVKLQEELNTLE